MMPTGIRLQTEMMGLRESRRGLDPGWCAVMSASPSTSGWRLR
jgi:hypothetical protein